MLVSILVATASLPTSAQPDTPDLIEGCGTSGPKIERGQTGIALGDTALKIDVPDAGTYFSLPTQPDTGGIGLLICHVESGSSIVISANTGTEVRREIGNPAGEAILDKIAESARIEPVALPKPSTDAGVQEMTPPSTGDAGLKSPMASP